MIDKVKIKKLAEASFKKNELDKRSVERISQVLKKEDLKYYIKTLKASVSKKTITLIVPDDSIDSLSILLKKINKAYPDKKVLIQTDPSLIAGIKIVNDDSVYEVSIKGMLEELITKL